MTLSKLEIQQMLREMNVKFDADDTYEELKHRLQQENHSLWLKSVSGGDHAAPRDRKVLVKKRKKKASPAPTEGAPAAATPIESSDAQRATATVAPRAPKEAERHYRPRPIEKPEPGKPWKAVADGVEPFNRKKKVFETVLRRAAGCCERCDQTVGGEAGGDELLAYHITPIDQGGEHSIKNVVAVCRACSAILENDPSARDLKELKRKTRSKLYDSLQVMRKKSVHRRRTFSGRRKPS